MQETVFALSLVQDILFSTRSAIYSACNCCHYIFQQSSLKYSAFYPLSIIGVAFVHRRIFQLDIWSNFFYFIGHFPTLRIHPPFWTRLVWSWGCFNHAQNNPESTMICTMLCLMWTLLITKHVSFAIRLTMFRPSVNTALVELNLHNIVISIATW